MNNLLLFSSQDVVLMCQAMEKVFNQKLATMPAEVIRELCFL